MTTRQRPLGFMVVLALASILVLGPGFTRPALAAAEDVAMFYDDLSQYGQWVEYENYGPVWRPDQVSEDWRPYTDGRWVPTDDGHVFETAEPWGWATYHYGNWMPTAGQGWVWVPGRTWYPSTVEWRTSPENSPVDSSYIGWAPIPPPNYVPPPGYAPDSYYQGSPIADLLTAPFWIFAKAAEFLLGFGQPYVPSYSYMTAGCLVPPSYVPVFYPQTVIVPTYFTPSYYPASFYGVSNLGFAAYNWGPPVRYISRVTNINQTVITKTISYNSLHITRIRNVVAPRTVISRHAHVRQIIPPALIQGRRLPRSRPVGNIRMAQANLYKPNILPPPRKVPAVRTDFPRLKAAAVTPERGLPGTALPPRATMPLTPAMEGQIRDLPPQKRFVPAAAPPYRRAGAPPERMQPGFQAQPAPGPAIAPTPPGQVREGLPARGEPAPADLPARRGPGQPSIQAQPGAAPPSQARPGEFRPRPGRLEPTPAPPRGPSATPSRPVEPPSYRGLSPEQRQRMERQPQRVGRGTGAQQPSPGQRLPEMQQRQRWQQTQPPQRSRQWQQEGQRQQEPRQRQLQQRQLQQQQTQQQQMRTRQLQQQQQMQQRARELQKRQPQVTPPQQIRTRQAPPPRAPQQQIQRQAPPRVRPQPQTQAPPRPQPQQQRQRPPQPEKRQLQQQQEQ